MGVASRRRGSFGAELARPILGERAAAALQYLPRWRSPVVSPYVSRPARGASRLYSWRRLRTDLPTRRRARLGTSGSLVLSCGRTVTRGQRRLQVRFRQWHRWPGRSSTPVVPCAKACPIGTDVLRVPSLDPAPEASPASVPDLLVDVDDDGAMVGRAFFPCARRGRFSAPLHAGRECGEQ